MGFFDDYKFEARLPEETARVRSEITCPQCERGESLIAMRLRNPRDPEDTILSVACPKCQVFVAKPTLEGCFDVWPSKEQWHAFWTDPENG